MTATATSHDLSHRPLTTGRVLLVLFAALALIVVVSLMTWQRLTPSTAATGTTSHTSAMTFSGGTAYLPGGSVYAEQVPADAAAEVTAYSPGGSVYAEQVPADAAADLTAYSPGGSVYAEQVPGY